MPYSIASIFGLGSNSQSNTTAIEPQVDQSQTTLTNGSSQGISSGVSLQMAVAQQRAAMQSSFGQSQAAHINNGTGYISSPYSGLWDNFPIQTAPPPRFNIINSLNQLSSDWVRNGLNFIEIIVSKQTFRQLQDEYGAMMRYNNQIPYDEAITELTLNTYHGAVKIICEGYQKIDFDKYMEDVG